MNYLAAYTLSAAMVAMIVIGANYTAQPAIHAVCGHYDALTNIVDLSACGGVIRQGVPQ